MPKYYCRLLNEPLLKSLTSQLSVFTSTASSTPLSIDRFQDIYKIYMSLKISRT